MPHLSPMKHALSCIFENELKLSALLGTQSLINPSLFLTFFSFTLSLALAVLISLIFSFALSLTHSHSSPPPLFIFSTAVGLAAHLNVPLWLTPGWLRLLSSAVAILFGAE